MSLRDHGVEVMIGMAASVRVQVAVAVLSAAAGVLFVVLPAAVLLLPGVLRVGLREWVQHVLGFLFVVAGGALVVAGGFAVAFDRFRTRTAVRWASGWALGLCVVALVFGLLHTVAGLNPEYAVLSGVGITIGTWAAFAGVVIAGAAKALVHPRPG